MCFEIDNTRVLYEIINDQQQNKKVHVHVHVRDYSEGKLEYTQT